MIQRIQTVYMLLSAILLALLFVLPFADIAANAEVYQFNIRGISANSELLANGWPVAMLICILVLVHVFAIFQYKKRVLQMRLLVFAILAGLGLFGMFFFFTYYGFEGATVSFKLAVAFPLVACILDYLAIRGIGKDEALIRSLNRIR